MALVQVKDAEGSVLDWMVARCKGTPAVRMFENSKGFRVYENESMKMQGINFAPSTNWSQGGPIIEREKIELIPPTSPSRQDEANHAVTFLPLSTRHRPRHRPRRLVGAAQNLRRPRQIILQRRAIDGPVSC